MITHGSVVLGYSQMYFIVKYFWLQLLYLNVLQFSKSELMNTLGISDKESEELLLIISKSYVSQPVTAWDIFNQKKNFPNEGFLQTSLKALDLILCGGIPVGSITEVVGPPAVGKTQFCILLTIMATMPTCLGGLNGSVIYIDTECAFTAKRLKEMAENRFPSYFSSNKVTDSLKQVGIFRPTTLQDLLKLTRQIEQDVLRRNVKLIIIDSMASLVRNDFGSIEKGNIIERSNTLSEQASILKNIAKTFKAVIFLTNQITTEVTDYSDSLAEDMEVEGEIDSSPLTLMENNHSLIAKENLEYLCTSKQHVIPCLGNTWAHCVNTRLLIHFVNLQKRQLIIWKSPIAPNVALHFTVKNSGIELTSQEVVTMNCFNPKAFNILTKCDFLNNCNAQSISSYEY